MRVRTSHRGTSLPVAAIAASSGRGSPFHSLGRMSPQQLFERIVQVAPSFASVEAEHLRDNGALLPHVLMGDLLRFVGEHIGRAQHQPQPEVLAVLELLEAEVAGGNAEAQNLIAVSFSSTLKQSRSFTDSTRCSARGCAPRTRRLPGNGRHRRMLANPSLHLTCASLRLSHAGELKR